MKICPLCHVKFEESAEFCPTCKAQLEELAEAEKAEKQKIPKSFWWTIIGVFAFIGGMALVYSLVYSKIYGL